MRGWFESVAFVVGVVLVSAVVTLGIAFLLLVTLGAAPAHAQVMGGYMWGGKSVSSPGGAFRRGWNVTSSEIADGTLVMSDTMAVTSQGQVAYGKGFRTWSGVPADIHRVLGILIGPVSGYQQGTIITEGTHFNVLLDGTAFSAGVALRPSFTTAGALTAWVAGDSARMNRFPVGRFQRYATTTSLRGYVEIDVSGKR